MILSLQADEFSGGINIFMPMRGAAHKMDEQQGLDKAAEVAVWQKDPPERHDGYVPERAQTHPSDNGTPDYPDRWEAGNHTSNFESLVLNRPWS